MSVAVSEVTTVDLSHWAPGVKFYRAADGCYFVVSADLGAVKVGRRTRVRRPTVVLYTDENAVPLDAEVDFVFDPGTSHEDAVGLAGFELGEMVNV